MSSGGIGYGCRRYKALLAESDYRQLCLEKLPGDDQRVSSIPRTSSPHSVHEQSVTKRVRKVQRGRRRARQVDKTLDLSVALSTTELAAYRMWPESFGYICFSPECRGDRMNLLAAAHRGSRSVGAAFLVSCFGWLEYGAVSRGSCLAERLPYLAFLAPDPLHPGLVFIPNDSGTPLAADSVFHFLQVCQTLKGLLWAPISFLLHAFVRVVVHMQLLHMEPSGEERDRITSI